MSAITQFLPKNHLSYLVGILVHLPLPSFVWTPVIKVFAKVYNINLEEAEKPVDQYKSLGEFFIRQLKPGARPVGQTAVLHPADSVITQAAVMSGGRLIQAKNKTYFINDFIFDQKGLEIFNEGFFLTYYLCPTDYHRVHSPVDGVIQKVVHIPGALWPVNQWSTENIDEMFSINERIYVEIKTANGIVGVVFVGATNVGQIELSFDSEIRGNQFKLTEPLVKEGLTIPIKKSEELGLFRMGSTVVMLYQKGYLEKTLNMDTMALTTKLSHYQGRAVKVKSDL